MRERRIGIFAIFDGVTTDVVFGCRIHLGAVDPRPLGAQLVQGFTNECHWWRSFLLAFRAEMIRRMPSRSV
jgi:hypothetical protein